MKINDINFEFLSFRIQIQNKIVKHLKNVIIRRIKIIIIDLRFLLNYKKIINVVTYLHNWIFKQSLIWKLSFEIYHEIFFKLVHLKIYKFKIYAMIKNVQKELNDCKNLFYKFILIDWLNINRLIFFAFEFLEKK